MTFFKRFLNAGDKIRSGHPLLAIQVPTIVVELQYFVTLSIFALNRPTS